MTSGGALLKNFDELLGQTTNIPVAVARNPTDCVAFGTDKTFDVIRVLKDTSLADTSLAMRTLAARHTALSTQYW